MIKHTMHIAQTDDQQVLHLPEDMRGMQLDIEVAAGARVICYDEQWSAQRSIVCRLGAHAQVTFLQQHKRIDDARSHIAFLLQQESLLQFHGLYTKQIDMTIDITLAQPKASADVRALVCATDQQKMRFITKQLHQASDTKSSVMLKSMVHERARLFHEGIIHITADAPRSDAAERSDHLLCSPYAQAYAVPALEAVHNDVQCVHGSAIGTFDEALCIYLQSRGVSRGQAKRLLQDAFCAEVLPENERMRKLFVRAMRLL